jgi:hypothetical protein
MQPVPQGARRSQSGFPADQVHRAGDRIGAASTRRNGTNSDRRYASDVSGVGVYDPRAPRPHTSRRTTRNVAARRTMCRRFRQAPCDRIPNDRIAPCFGLDPHYGVRSAVLHLDEAAVHGPSFCYPEACVDTLQRRSESGACTPDSLFIVTRGRVNKKQQIRRRIDEKNRTSCPRTHISCEIRHHIAVAAVRGSYQSDSNACDPSVNNVP